MLVDLRRDDFKVAPPSLSSRSSLWTRWGCFIVDKKDAILRVLWEGSLIGCGRHGREARSADR